VSRPFRPFRCGDYFGLFAQASPAPPRPIRTCGFPAYGWALGLHLMVFTGATLLQNYESGFDQMLICSLTIERASALVLPFGLQVEPLRSVRVVLSRTSSLLWAHLTAPEPVSNFTARDYIEPLRRSASLRSSPTFTQKPFMNMQPRITPAVLSARAVTVQTVAGFPHIRQGHQPQF
jgi:hypothetical protein